MASVFTRIIKRELPAKIFYETDEVIVIADHFPRAPVHLLIIPKQEFKNFYETPSHILRLMDETAKIVAEKLHLEDRFRIIINNGLGQQVDHIHYHFMSDRDSDGLKYVTD